MKQLTSLIHLIDFIGHPSLNEQYLNDRRYNALHSLINERKTCDNKVITTLFNPDDKPLGEKSALYLEKFIEIKNIAIKYNFTWLELNEECSVNDITISLENLGYKIDPSYTQIVFGGTNLSGCVLRNKNTSLREFTKYGYLCQLVLPLCCPSDTPGYNDIEKLFSSLAAVYNYTRDKNITHLVDILYTEYDMKLHL